MLDKNDENNSPRSINEQSLNKTESTDTLLEIDLIQTNLKTKSVSVIDAFAIVFGTIVGSGIFMGVQVPYFIFESHSILFVAFFWLIFGVICIFGGLCYAELGTRIPESGGDRAYLKQLLSQKISRVFVIFYVFIIRTLSISGLTITAATYILKIFINKPEEYYYLCRFVAIIIIGLSFAINCFSKYLATKTGVVTTFTKSVAILIIIISGIYYLATNETQSWNDYKEMKGFSVEQFGLSMLAIFWAYDGCNTLGMVAGDMVNPSRDLPIAIILGMGLVVLLYVLTVISYPAILGYEMARKSSGVAYDCAVKIFGRYAPIMSILIFSSAFGSANSLLYSISSTATSAGLSGELPKIFSLVNRNKRTCIFSATIISILSSIGTFLDFNTILGYVSFTALIFYILSYISLILVKIKTKSVSKVGIFNVPFVLIFTVQALSLLMIILSFQVRKVGSLVFTILLLVVYQCQFIEIPEDNKWYKMIKNKELEAINFLETYLWMQQASLDDIS